MNQKDPILINLPTQFGWKWGTKELKKTVTNFENSKYKFSNKKLQQVLIETVKFITSNMAKFKKKLRQLSAKETGEIIDKDREKVRQNKKKLKGNTDKMLKVKKSNIISKTILVEKEKSGEMKNSRGVPFPFSSTGVPSPSPSTGVSSPSSSISVLSPSSPTGENSTFSFSSHSSNDQKIADSPFPS